MESYKIYCAGEFIETAAKLKVIYPFTGEQFAETFLATEELLDKAVKKAEDVQKELKSMPSFMRYEILMSIAEMLEKGKERMAEIICMEAGKPLKYSKAEVERAIQIFIIAAEESKRLPKEYISLDWTPQGKNKEGIIKYFPVGLVAGISPFNFPLNLAVHKIAPAIAAGCPIILKPASSTPLATLELAKMIDKTRLPKGAVSILPMDRVTGNKLVTDERMKLLTFTGSPEVGWQMKKDAGKKKVVLELGGNAGVIVGRSADIEHAVKRCLIGGYAYSGQVCIHVQRIYVQRSMFGKFAEEYIKAVKTLKYGDPLKADTDISVMIDEANAIRVESWVNEAIESGAKVLCGGKRKGNYYEPTVLTNTKSSMKVNSREIFGPVVTLEAFDKFDEAVERVNEGVFGLQAGVFSDEQKEINYAFENLDVGGVIVNDSPSFRVDHMPYGGIKDSGLGREGVKYAIMDMLEAKILVNDTMMMDK